MGRQRGLRERKEHGAPRAEGREDRVGWEARACRGQSTALGWG